MVRICFVWLWHLYRYCRIKIWLGYVWSDCGTFIYMVLVIRFVSPLSIRVFRCLLFLLVQMVVLFAIMTCIQILLTEVVACVVDVPLFVSPPDNYVFSVLPELQGLTRTAPDDSINYPECLLSDHWKQQQYVHLYRYVDMIRSSQ